MKNDYVKISIFAKEIGRTRIAVFKAGQRGTFPMEEIDGVWQVDRNHPDTIAYKEASLERQNKPVEVPAPKQPKIKKPVKVKKQKKPETIKSVKVAKPKTPEKKQPVKSDIVKQPKDLPYDIYERLNSGESLTNVEIVNLPKAWVEKIKIYESTKQIVQKRQQERKELINVRSLKLLFGKIYDIDVNEFMSIKTRVKSKLYKIFETNDDKKMLEAESALDEELWDTLRRIKTEFNKYLEKLKNDNI